MKNNKYEVFEAAKYRCPIPLPYIQKGDFLFCQSLTSIWLCIVDRVEGNRIYYSVNYNLKAELMKMDDWFLADYVKRVASQEEKTLLIEYLNKKGLSWIDSEKKMLKSEDVFYVPDSITLVDFSIKGLKEVTQIGIVSQSKTTVLLGKGRIYGIFIPDPVFTKKISCALVPCNFSDLKNGDVAFRTKKSPYRQNPDFHILSRYVKILSNGYVYLDGETITKSYDCNYLWYKVVKQ